MVQVILNQSDWGRNWYYQNKTTGVNDASSSHVFIFHFFTTFSFFHSPRCLFLLVRPSSSSLFPPRPAMSKLFRFRKNPFFTKSSVTDGRTDGRTDGPTNQPTNGPTDGQGLLQRCEDASKKLLQQLPPPPLKQCNTNQLQRQQQR